MLPRSETTLVSSNGIIFPVERNPADIGTRDSSLLQLMNFISIWLPCPEFLFSQKTKILEFYPLLVPEVDSVVRTIVAVRYRYVSLWDMFVLGVLILEQTAIPTICTYAYCSFF